MEILFGILFKLGEFMKISYVLVDNFVKKIERMRWQDRVIKHSFLISQKLFYYYLLFRFTRRFTI